MNQSILYSEVSLVCVLFLIIIANKIRFSMFKQLQRNLFYLVTLLMISFLCLDSLWVFVNNHALKTAVYTNWILNILYYILSAVLAFCFFLYSEAVQDSSVIKNKLIIILSAIPITLLIICSILSIQTKWIFYIDSNNVYHRGVLYPFQLVCTYGYIFFTSIKAFVISLRCTEYQKKIEMITLTKFVVPTLIFGSLQVIFPAYPLLCVGNTVGVLYIFLTQQEQLISQDPLTHLNNRNQFYQFYSTKILHHSENFDVYLLLMDVDFFKKINDKYGHLQGDLALKNIASALKKVGSDKHYFISRFGGDEFIMICQLQKNELIQDVCDSIHSEINKITEPCKLSLSIGYAKKTKDSMEQSQLIALADAELYKVKKSRTVNR